MASLQGVLGSKFDAKNTPAQTGFDNAPLPAGVYSVEITDAELKDLKSGNGQAIKVEYTVISPEPYARRKLWSNFNVVHSNEKAQEIGRSQLSALCAAVGIEELGDTDELFQRTLNVRVKIRPAQGSYSESNDVVSWEAAGTPTVTSPAPRPTAAAKPAMPWKK